MHFRIVYVVRFRTLARHAQPMLQVVSFLRPAEASMLAHHATYFIKRGSMGVMEDEGVVHNTNSNIALDSRSYSEKYATWWREFGRSIISCLSDANGRDIATLLTAVVKAQVTLLRMNSGTLTDHDPSYYIVRS